MNTKIKLYSTRKFLILTCLSAFCMTSFVTGYAAPNTATPSDHPALQMTNPQNNPVPLVDNAQSNPALQVVNPQNRPGFQVIHAENKTAPQVTQIENKDTQQVITIENKPTKQIITIESKPTQKQVTETKKIQSNKVIKPTKIYPVKKTAIVATATAANDIQWKPVQQLRPVKIHVLRPSGFWGNIMTTPIYINNHYVGRVGSGGYLTWLGHPGVITITTTEGQGVMKFQKSGTNAIRFEAKEGYSYDVVVTVPYQINIFGTAYELQLVK